MLPLQSIETAPPPSTADENGEHRQQKPKTLPCQYCSKRFRSAHSPNLTRRPLCILAYIGSDIRRVEHVQRHERTHTKEDRKSTRLNSSHWE